MPALPLSWPTAGAATFPGLPPGFVAGFTTRHLSPDGLPAFQGVRRLAAALGAPEAEAVIARQVHGRVLLVLDRPAVPLSSVQLGEGDALMTRESGRLLAVVSADCAPILLLDPDSGWIAAVHAGWRGTSLRILDPVLETLLQRGAALSRLLVLIGPCISRDRYEVGPDVVEALDEAYASFDLDGAKRPAPDGRAFVDVAGYNRALLRRRGVTADRILSADLCTASRPDLFPSYRRDGPGAGRIITGIARLP